MSNSGAFWTWGDIQTTTGSISNSVNMTAWFIPEHRCASDGFHTIRFVHARGSNGHMRRETGECIYCDKVYHRLIRWDEKRAEWWEPVKKEAA